MKLNAAYKHTLPTRALITGGAGFIGGHLAGKLCSLGVEVVVIDSLRTGRRSNLDSLPIKYVNGCITDRSLVRDAVKGCDAVFHLAALVSVPESIEKLHDCISINVSGLLVVMEESVSAGARKFVFSSSAAIYGDDPRTPKVESMMPLPKSPYAITKLDGEYYCDLFYKNYGMETACLRYFNVFGPRQNPRSAYAAAVPIFIEKALAGEPITIYGDGEQTRDFVYVEDVVSANVHAASSVGLTGVYNVGYNSSISINKLADVIREKCRSTSEVLHAPCRPGDVRNSEAQVDRLLQAGWVPVHSLESGLDLTIDWYRNAKPD